MSLPATPVAVEEALALQPFKALTTRRNLAITIRAFRAAWTALEQQQVLSAACLRLCERAAIVLRLVHEHLEAVEKRERDAVSGRVVVEREFEFQLSAENGREAGAETVFKAQATMLDVQAFAIDFAAQSTGPTRLPLLVCSLAPVRSALSTLNASLTSLLAHYALSHPSSPAAWAAEDAVDIASDNAKLPRLFQLSLALRGPLFERFVRENPPQDGSAASPAERRDEFVEWCYAQNELLCPGGGTGDEAKDTLPRRARRLQGSWPPPEATTRDDLAAQTAGQVARGLAPPIMRRAVSQPMPPTTGATAAEVSPAPLVQTPNPSAAAKESILPTPAHDGAPSIVQDSPTSPNPPVPAPSLILASASPAQLDEPPVCSPAPVQSAPPPLKCEMQPPSRGEGPVDTASPTEPTSPPLAPGAAATAIHEIDVAPRPTTAMASSSPPSSAEHTAALLLEDEPAASGASNETVESASSTTMLYAASATQLASDCLGSRVGAAGQHSEQDKVRVPVIVLAGEVVEIDLPLAQVVDAPSPNSDVVAISECADPPIEQVASAPAAPTDARPSEPLATLSDSLPSPVEPFRVLSLDDTGLVGPIAQFVLLEVRLRTSRTDSPARHFALMVGTSASALLAVLLGRVQLSVEDALALYMQIAKRALPLHASAGSSAAAPTKRRRWSRLFRRANEPFFRDSEDTGRYGARIALQVFQADTTTGKIAPRLLRDDDPACELTLAQAILASCAASPFFAAPSSLLLPFTSSPTSLNPSTAALDIARELCPVGGKVELLSLGTGYSSLRLDDPSLSLQRRSVLQTVKQFAAANAVEAAALSRRVAEHAGVTVERVEVDVADCGQQQRLRISARLVIRPS
ncbi:hypothetical protein Rhopal_001201-T1 [Rhodotorula paludigena]|uniref:PNPLA domain-containing protein n=1 Tax=Rhodotorula paludigena TaxID=86838 RepID=A0AAV5G6P2_9BASI|nr:hypothetical protein Rhopal_001201-T1 [Rhodotorula paludigena]